MVIRLVTWLCCYSLLLACCSSLEYRGGILTYDSFDDNSTYVVIKIRLSYSLTSGDDFGICAPLVVGAKETVQIKDIPLQIESQSLSNETTFTCVVNKQLKLLIIDDQFVRNYNGNMSATEKISLFGRVTANDSQQWSLNTTVDFAVYTEENVLSSPPFGFVPSGATINKNCESKMPLAVVNANRFGVLNCDLESVLWCDTCNLLNVTTFFNVSQNCQVFASGNAPAGIYLLDIRVVASSRGYINETLGFSQLHIALTIEDQPQCNSSFVWDTDEKSGTLFYHDLMQRYCDAVELEIPDIQLNHSQHAQVYIDGPLDASLIKIASLPHHTNYIIRWKPQVSDLGANVICLTASNVTSNEKSSVCYYIKIYLFTDDSPYYMCGTMPGCHANTLCVSTTTFPSTMTSTPSLNSTSVSTTWQDNTIQSPHHTTTQQLPSRPSVSYLKSTLVSTIGKAGTTFSSHHTSTEQLSSTTFVPSLNSTPATTIEQDNTILSSQHTRPEKLSSTPSVPSLNPTSVFTIVKRDTTLTSHHTTTKSLPNTTSVPYPNSTLMSAVGKGDTTLSSIHTTVKQLTRSSAINHTTLTNKQNFTAQTNSTEAPSGTALTANPTSSLMLGLKIGIPIAAVILLIAVAGTVGIIMTKNRARVSDGIVLERVTDDHIQSRPPNNHKTHLNMLDTA